MAGDDLEAQVLAIAEGLQTPEREAEVDRHYRAMLEALNGSHVDGEQDALAVFEALAIIIAQVTAAAPDNTAVRMLVYIHVRAQQYHAEILRAGTAARHIIEPEATHV